MTEPGEERVGVLLAAAARQVARLVARELLPVLQRGGGKWAGTWAQSCREVPCHEARGMARLGQRWGASDG